MDMIDMWDPLEEHPLLGTLLECIPMAQCRTNKIEALRSALGEFSGYKLVSIFSCGGAEFWG